MDGALAHPLLQTEFWGPSFQHAMRHSMIADTAAGIVNLRLDSRSPRMRNAK